MSLIRSHVICPYYLWFCTTGGIVELALVCVVIVVEDREAYGVIADHPTVHMLGLINKIIFAKGCSIFF